MLKISSILTACLVLIQSLNIDFNDIVQLDELIAHSKFHAETHGDNFLLFMVKHYGELKQEHNKQHQEEKKEHEQLPFNNQSSVHTALASVFTPTTIVVLKLEPIKTKRSLFYYQELHSLFEKSSVFQPPKYA